MTASKRLRISHLEELPMPLFLKTCVGTYFFGLVSRWPCRSFDGRKRRHLRTQYNSDHMQGKVFSTPVTSVWHGALAGTKPIFLSHQSAVSLYYRYTSYLAQLNAPWDDFIVSGDDEQSLNATNRGGIVIINKDSLSKDKEVCDELMPGQRDTSFLNALRSSLERKYRNGHLPWTVTSDLYSLWSSTSHISTELFTDAMGESGVLRNFCSFAPEDVVFSSKGPWTLVESYVQGGCGIPPFDASLIQDILLAFESGVRRDTPYCGCAVLPIGKSYPVIEHLEKVTTEGILLLTIESCGLLFRECCQLESTKSTELNHTDHETLGLFVWRNREYLVRYPVPNDIEASYMRWSSSAIVDPFKAVVHYDSFRRAFPMDLRSRTQNSHLFDV